MQWRRINRCRPPRGTVVAGNFDRDSPHYDEAHQGRVVNIAGSGLYLVVQSGRIITVTHYQVMSDFDVVARFEPTGKGTYHVHRAGAYILATTFENAVFLANYLNIKWEGLCPSIEEIDASDIGGSLGLALNRFDPQNN